jgi:hypothetical protein
VDAYQHGDGFEDIGPSMDVGDKATMESLVCAVHDLLSGRYSKNIYLFKKDLLIVLPDTALIKIPRYGTKGLLVKQPTGRHKSMGSCLHISSGNTHNPQTLRS